DRLPAGDVGRLGVGRRVVDALCGIGSYRSHVDDLQASAGTLLLSQSDAMVNRANRICGANRRVERYPGGSIAEECCDEDIGCSRRCGSGAGAARAACRGALLVEWLPVALHASPVPSLRPVPVPVLRLLPLLPPLLLPALLRLRL